MKSEPLLAQDKQRAKANPTSKSKSLRQTAYKPPALDSTDDDESNLRGLTSPQAVAKAKQKARSNTRRRHEQEAISTDRYGSHKDRYGLRQDRYKVEEEDSSVFQSMEESDAADGAAYKSMEGSDGVYHEGLFTDSGTRGSTRGFTSGSDTNGDTADDTLGTYSQEEAKDSHRGMLKYRFSSLSENTSIEEGSVIIKQQVAWGCIGLSAVQFAILTTQVLLCGFAYASINPMLGPYPDAFSEWGGKNTYLLVEDGQYWRYITPTFLHVGYLHLMVNVFFQLETCAYFEREWGFFPWLFIYLCSGLGATLAASAIDPNLIGVCSSGALMGFFGARIAQAITWTAFETKVDYQGQGGVIFERLGGTVCSAAVVFFLTFLTYIDWSGHLGGLFAGFLVGFIYFAHAIQNPRTRRTVIFFAFLGLVLGGFALWAILYHIAQYDEELADACNYFRNLYREDYSCECQAFSDYD
jgi:membrane associated rhomboid family serine protease